MGTASVTLKLRTEAVFFICPGRASDPGPGLRPLAPDPVLMKGTRPGKGFLDFPRGEGIEESNCISYNVSVIMVFFGWYESLETREYIGVLRAGNSFRCWEADRTYGFI